MNMRALLSEHYNARGLTPQVLVESFVASRQFFATATTRSTVIVGPRGSGKTTLLRMLDPRALARLSPQLGANEDGYIPPEFIGLFVPIDTAWISALQNAVAAGDAASGGRLYLAVYSLACMRALVDVLQWRCSEESLGSRFHLEGESLDQDLAKALGSIWLPGRTIRSLLELRIHLVQEIAAAPGGRSAGVADRELTALLNPVSLIGAACEIVNMLTGEQNRKWALLCDELEIAPEIVQRVLFGSLRAHPAHLLLKLAFTPKSKIFVAAGDEAPMPANDYDPVSLSYPTREEGTSEAERERFCEEMWRTLVQRVMPERAADWSDPHRAFESLNSRATTRQGSGNDIDSKSGDAFRSLAEKDESFRAYLAAKQVSLDNLDANPQEIKDSVIRKVRAIVEVRNFYIRSATLNSVTRMPRRAALTYTGSTNIFTLSEGHPRWLKYTLASMLAKTPADATHVSTAVQNSEILQSVQRVSARLGALPARRVSVDDVIQKIGTYFRDEVLGKEFKADPYLSFVLDELVSPDAIEAIEQALYVGAVVPMQGDMYDFFTRGLAGRRFRLSHWLAPQYSLPLIVGKPVRLSSILSGRRISVSATDVLPGFEQ